MFYKHGVIRSFLLFLLSVSDVLYYYPHFMEREMRSRAARSMGKEELEIWTHDLVLSILQLGYVPLRARFTRSLKDLNLMEIFSFQTLVACHVTLDLVQVSFF